MRPEEKRQSRKEIKVGFVGCICFPSLLLVWVECCGGLSGGRIYPECVDVSNTEQLALCFQFVGGDFSVCEEFMGLYQCPDITADTLVSVCWIYYSDSI